MTDFVVRSAEDAWCAITQLGSPSCSFDGLRFEGWPRLVLTVPEGIHVVSASPTIIKLQKAVDQHFCLIKYGTPDRRHLTERDKHETRLDARFEANHTRLVIDFSKAATAASRAARLPNAFGQGTTAKTAGLFTAPPNPEFSDHENWPRAAREVGLAIVGKLRPASLAAMGMIAILVAGLAWTGATFWKESLSHAFDMAKVANEHQLKLVELDRATIVARDGKPLSKSARLAVERQLAEEDRRVKHLASFELEGPLYRFALAQAEQARPALLAGR